MFQQYIDMRQRERLCPKTKTFCLVSYYIKSVNAVYFPLHTIQKAKLSLALENNFRKKIGSNLKQTEAG